MDVRADQLARFANGAIAERWTAARELMAARQLTSVIESEDFRSGFNEVGKKAKVGEGIDRLVAVDLLMRLSKFVRKLAPPTKDVLSDALSDPLPPATLLSESKTLPETAKPAEFRENIAAALRYASGDWVIPYALHALVQEDRSQRCRLELTRQLIGRERSIDKVLAWLVELTGQGILHPEPNLENAASRLRDIAAAMAGVIQPNRVRLEVSEHGALRLAELCRLLVPIRSQSKLPKSLGKAAAEVQTTRLAERGLWSLTSFRHLMKSTQLSST